MTVDAASIEGGNIPVDPKTMMFIMKTPENVRYVEDLILQAKMKNSMRIHDADFRKYDVVFLPGGWGAAYDLGYSSVLGEKFSKAY